MSKFPPQLNEFTLDEGYPKVDECPTHDKACYMVRYTHHCTQTRARMYYHVCVNNGPCDRFAELFAPAFEKAVSMCRCRRKLDL